MAKKPLPSTATTPRPRRRFSEEFRREAVQVLLDGYAAVDVARRLGLSAPNLLYRWSIAATMAESLVLDALRQAIRGRRPAAGLIHHSDTGAASMRGTPTGRCSDEPGWSRA
ncbi:MAG: transposase [Planctomycetia bacterium]